MRLAAVEEKVSSFDALHDEANLDAMITSAVRNESATLQSRMDDFEDRARRENLVFYGISDCAEETWAEAENKIRGILSGSFKLQLSEEAITRAHRLGAFVENKCRPIIVQFASFKTKDSIFSQKSKLRGTNISVTQDFCKATRTVRKKLLEFAKATGQPFSLKYNKVVIDKKSYVYCSITDRVVEIDLQDGRFQNYRSNDNSLGQAGSCSPNKSEGVFNVARCAHTS